jgi:tyrosine-protein kinase Etk/Wzc
MAKTHSEALRIQDMNARSSLQTQLALPPDAPAGGDNDLDLLQYWDIIVDNRWLIAAVTALTLGIGIAYALLTAPVYEADLLVQVEDSASSTKNLFGEAAGFFDIKTPAAAEMEILRSRMVIGRAVDSTSFFVEAMPRYLPIVGNWLARHAKTVSDPGVFGFGGYVTGTEKISVAAFDVPQHFEGSLFRLTARPGNRYALSHPDLPDAIDGTIGTPLIRNTPFGAISLLVTAIQAKPGAQFNLIRRSRQVTIQGLQNSLKLVERGRQSGVIDATLQGVEPQRLTLILNEVGHQYVQQNVERKAAEAQKMLAFLDVQMPQFKRQLDQSDQAYSRYRNQKGTISLDEEAKAVLSQEVDLQSKLLDAKQKRLELVTRFTTEHPAVKTLDGQILAWKREIETLHARVHDMPSVQQEALRLQRDVMVANDAYQNLRNNALQLQLMREGKVGNVRVIDQAAAPLGPVKPNQPLVLSLSAVLGLLGGVILALAKNALHRGIRDPQEIESHIGLNVYSTIPLSSEQEALAAAATAREPGIHLLAVTSPRDAAIESLRSLRTALQFAMLESPNNRVLVTGATPGVGKSFVSSNFAAILANAGKRVLLVDADLRKGHLNHYFGVDRERGLSELVAGTLQPSDAIRREVLPHLDLLTTGVLPPNPAELMMSGAFAHVLDEISAEYDLVILDTPPVLVAADTVGISSRAGTVLLVARADLTQLGELHESAKRLAHAGKTVSGVLFNAMDLSRRHYGSYGYKYGGYQYKQYSY